MIPAGAGGSGFSSGGTSTGGLRYPNNRIDKDTDWVNFTFYKYRAPFSKEGLAAGAASNSATTSTYNNSSSTAALGSSQGNVQLYMPEDIEGEYGASWTEQNLSGVARGALGTFGATAGGDPAKGLGIAIDQLKTSTENFLTKGTGVVNAISGALAQANFGSLTVNDIFSVSTGQILNPNTEVLYKGPKMRNFSLSFKMVPMNESDTTRIKSIIHKFKYAMLPEFGGQGGEAASFVKVPQIVDVSFMKGGGLNPWVTQFKPCVITNLSVSYTPDGAWARLPNGSPVATTMKISFQETKMVYANELSDTGATY